MVGHVEWVQFARVDHVRADGAGGQQLLQSEVSCRRGPGQPELGDGAAAISDKHDLAAGHPAKVAAEMGFEVANSGGDHSDQNVVSCGHICKRLDRQEGEPSHGAASVPRRLWVNMPGKPLGAL